MTTHAIGQVETVTGEVLVTRTDGTGEILEQGAPVFQGDTVETGPVAAVAIVFVDDTTFSLDEDASMALDELTALEDRDDFAGTPWHKFVPARLEPLRAR